MKIYKVIFVDCFDTLIKRNISAKKVLDIWAEKISLIYPVLDSIKWRFLYNSSDLCIRRKNNKEFGEYEADIDDVIADMFDKLLCNGIEVKDKKELFCKKLFDLYLNIEESVQYINVQICDYLRKQKQFGAKIYLLSDFYCKKPFFETIFNKLGILDLFDGIYSSCEVLKTKSKGKLYEFVLNELKVNPKNCLMIGDNKFSDIKMAKKYGINVKQVKIEKTNKKKTKAKQKYEIDKYLYRIFKSNKKYNFENFAFPLFLFCQKLAKEVENKKIKNLFFLSREGQFLKVLFDNFCKQFNINVNTHYLLVSRNSTMLASCKDLSTEKFEIIFRERKSMSVDDFLTSLSFNSDVKNLILMDLDFDTNKKIDNFDISDEFKKLKESKIFKTTYEKLRLEQHQIFKEYLQSFGVDIKKERLYIVDVGWKGTMQDNIKRIISDINITGYYVAILSDGSKFLENQKFGLLHSCVPFYNYNDNLFTLGIVYLEQILKADHNKVCNYVKKDNKIDFVYECSFEAEFFKKSIEPFQKLIFDKFILICNYYAKSNFNKIDQDIRFLYRKMLIKANYNDYKFIFRCLSQHFDTFGYIGYYKMKYPFLQYILEKLRLYKKLILEREMYE